VDIRIHGESKIPTSEVKIHPDNPRVHDEAQISEIVASIKRFGYTSPILIDEDNMLLAGHARLVAAQVCELPEISFTRIVGLTPVQKKAYLVADNKLAMRSTWNVPSLKSILDEMQIDGIDLSDVGFSDDEYSRLCDDLDKINLGADESTTVKEHERDTARSADGDQVVIFSIAVSLDKRDSIVSALKKYQEQHALANSSESLCHLSERILSGEILV
jgi:ParB-like chromosome segregation protein Spo0J